MKTLSIIVPTRNEAANIAELVSRVRAAVRGHDAELLVMDDASPDGTPDLAEKAGPGFVRAVRRTGPPGLARAVIDGFSETGAPYLAVMDADLSHPPELLPDLLAPVASGEADLAVASRYVPGGSTPDWPLSRRVISQTACFLARPFTSIADPTSGFFLCRREVVSGMDFDPRGFKILLEVLVKGRWRKVVEIPYAFHDRKHGKSKMGSAPVLHFLGQLAALAPHRRGVDQKGR